MIRNGSKWIISTSGGLELLQMILGPDTGQCVNEDAGPKGVDCKIPHRLKRGTKHFLQGCGNFSLVDAF